MSATSDRATTTGESVDPRFNDPYIDVDEWRDEPVRHRYVHGGFTGTDAKFAFTFPPPELYEGRFFQVTHQLLGGEDPQPSNIGFAVDSRGYFVQTNMGGAENPRSPEQSNSPEFDKSIGGYRVNAESAKYSRVVAAKMYGPHRTYGYLYGGSGGSYQTITSAEFTTGVWDGFVPFVMGTPQSIPNMFTVRVNAIRVLKDKWPQVLDAIEPGGSGDPYAGLNDEERTALEEATRTGFPPRAWFTYLPQGGGPIVLVAGYVPVLDPTYIDDFWTQPGYLGTDASSSVAAARTQHPATVLTTIATPKEDAFFAFMTPPGGRLQLTSVPTGDTTGADLIITSGAAAGKTLPLGRVEGDTVGFGVGADPAVVDSIAAGDELRIDNSRFLALQTYHRHQFPPANPEFDYPDVYDYYRNADGSPKYPHRGVDVGAAGAKNASGEINDGHFNGRMIVVECLLDGDALPWQADWYRQKVEAAETAAGRAPDENYRLWYFDNAQHGDPRSEAQQTHVVAYSGALQQALRDVSAWVERGEAPAPTTQYSVKDGQVQVPASAAARRGIQPVVHLTVNDAERADVGVGDTVTFSAQIQVPPDTGTVVAADWDFEGVGTYPEPAELGEASADTVEATAKHAFAKPGTYFPALRVASQREGNANTPFALVQNLGRVRVVVS